jgi:hypothetical protein
MRDKCTFEYAIIRVIPKVEREEFLNVGAIVFSKSRKFLAMKHFINEARLRSFSPEMDIEELKKHLAAWEAVCAGSPAGGFIGQLDLADRFRWLTAARSTILQSTRPHPGICSDPEKELEWLFQAFVL